MVETLIKLSNSLLFGQIDLTFQPHSFIIIAEPVDSMIVKERIPVIFYLHQYPVNEKKKFGQKRSLTPLPMDYSQCGYYSDRIYNAHNSAARFYVVTFGYAKSWGIIIHMKDK